MKSWGEEIWDAKASAHSSVGVILGTGFGQKHLDENTRNILNIFDKDFLPSIPEGGEILDMGVGPAARFAIALSERGYRLTGCDISSTTIEKAGQASQSLPENQRPDLVVGDMTALNLGKTFDGIYCVETFFHIPGHLQMLAFQSFHQHLKPSGKLVVQFSVLNRLTPSFLAYSLFYMSVYKFAKPVLESMGRKTFYTNVNRVSEDEVSDIADRTGFTIEAKHPGGFFVFKKKS